jgi:hypothetical protein
VFDNSTEGLVAAFRKISAELQNVNKKIRMMKLESAGRPTITLLTRDWSKAYFQFAMAEPSYFTWFDVDANEWKLAKSFVLNMGALQAIMGFWRISEFMQHTLWRLGIPCICYIDDLIVVIQESRHVKAQFLIDSLNALLGLENSSKPAARQCTAGANTA